MLARLFVTIGGLLVLALTAALVAPYFIDWTNYRAEFEREAGAILGRSVRVEGEARARLLPFPSVTFTDVVVGDDGTGGPAMTVEEFSMDAELAPFMRGEFLIFDMRLVQPKMTVAIGADGRIDWAVRPSTPFSATQIAIEKLTVTDGQIDIRDAAGGRSHKLTGINAQASARSLAGPWRVDGSLNLDGVRSALAISTGTADGDGVLRLRVRLDPTDYPLAIETDGDVHVDEGAARYVASFRAFARQEEPREDQAGENTPRTGKPGPPAWRVNGTLELDHRRLALGEFRLETGPQDDPYVADGSAFVDLGAQPRFEVTARGAQIRFDEAVGVVEGQERPTLKERIAAIRAALLDLPRPTIPGVIDVDLPAIVAGDTTIRDVKLRAEPTAVGWDLKSVHAALPGRTTLEGSGILTTGDDFAFRGSLLLAVAQPSGFASWLSSDVDEAIRRLPSAGFSADVDLSMEAQRFSNLELILGGAKFRGEVENREPADAKPSMRIELDGQALDFDGLAALSALFVSDAGAERFGGRDLRLRLRAGPVTAHGIVAERLDTALRVHDGTLEIDRLSIAGLPGDATVGATGKIVDFAARPAGNLDATIVSVDLAPLVADLARQFPEIRLLAELQRRAASFPGLLDDASIDLVGTAAHNDDGSSGLAVSANGKAGGTTFTLTLSGNGSPEAIEKAPINLTISAENEKAAPLLALYGFPALPLEIAGSCQALVTATGTLADGLKSHIELTGQDMQAGFEGRLQWSGGVGTAKGSVRVEAADLEPWLMTAGLNYPGMGFGMPVSLTAELDYGAHLLVASDIQGEVADGPVSGDLNIEMREGVPHLSGDLAVGGFDFAPVAAMLVGEDVLGSAEGDWPATPFRSAAAFPFTGEVDLSFNSLAAGRLVVEDAHMRASLGPDGIRLSDLTGTVYGGRLTGLFEARNNDGSALVSTQFKLEGAALERMLGGHGPRGQADLTASLSSAGKSVDALVASLSGSGTLEIGGLTLPGVNADAFPALLQEADRLGRDIDGPRTAAFAPAIVSDGELSAPQPVGVAFTVAAGVLRTPTVTIHTGKVKISSDLKVDFRSGLVTASGSLAYEAGDEGISGSEPAVGFSLEGPLDRLSVRYDTEPLAQFLTQRALQIEQARVEALQASLLERQRLRREVRYYAALQARRDRAAEAARLADRQSRRAAAEAKRRADEAAAKAAEDEARRRAEEEARRKAEEDERARAAEEETRRKAEEEARRGAAEEQRKPGNAGPPPKETRPLSPYSEDAISEFLESLKN